jgi:hypothetical protein
MTELDTSPPEETDQAAKRARELAVHLMRLAGEPLEGKPMSFLGKEAKLRLTKAAMVLGYQESVLAGPAWTVGLLLGSAFFWGLLLHYALPVGLAGLTPQDLLQIAVLPLAVITWALALQLAPRRAAELRLDRDDVVAVLVDPEQQRVLLQLTRGRLLGLQLSEPVDKVQRYAERRWPQVVHLGPARPPSRARGLFIAALVIVLLIAVAYVFTR